MKIEISNGELIDKLTILEIKLERITDQAKVANVRKEYDQLVSVVKKVINLDDPLYVKLKEVNQKLWEIEDRIRDFERKQEFGKPFVETARMVYFTNDLRARIKNDINRNTGSDLIEEKSYEDY